MADTPDKGTGQAADTGGKTATAPQGDGAQAKPPDVESLAKELQAEREAREKLAKDLQTWQGRYGNAERKIREQGAELGKYRQILQDSTGETVDTPSKDDAGKQDRHSQAALARSSWVMLTQERPEAAKLRAKVEEVLNDDTLASRFVHDDPYVMYSNVVDYLVREDERKEMEELREFKKKVDQSRDQMASAAVVSGATASVPTVDVSVDDIKKMSREEMEKKFGRSALLKGITQ